MGHWLIDGRANGGIDPQDRGFAYGDGLFETIAVRDGAPRLIDRHLARLTTGCRRLGIPQPSRALVRDEIERVVDGRRRGTVKVIVTRGRGPRGYAAPATAQPTRAVGFWPDEEPAGAPAALELGVCRTPASCNTVLAGLKTLNRLDNVLARTELQASGEREGLMSDAAGRIIGGTMTNLFVVRQGRILTPELTLCGIHGVMRGLVLELAAVAGLEILEADLASGHLVEAEEMFLTNALLGVWPVGRFAGRDLGDGPVSRLIASILCDYGVAEHAA